MLLEALGAFEDMPSWEDAADSLFNAGETLNPSALHGAMAGLFGAGFSPHTEKHFAATVAALESFSKGGVHQPHSPPALRTDVL